MRTSIPSKGTISRGSRGYRYAPAAVALALLLALGFAPSGFAQSLQFGNNYFVTGDYVVSGAYNMNSNTTTINGVTYTTGTINVPDMKPGGKTGNPGIQGVTSVPTGAQVVAALLYWQTAEMSTTVPGQAGSGENGFFRPVITNGPASPGYPLSGVNLSGNSTVSWSQGGCSTGQTGKAVRTYRADVTGYLPQDANGNVTPNIEYQVMLPSVGNATPLTLGATLVIIYRVLSPGVPLNSIVIYEGPFGQTTGSPATLNMTQTVQGFYDAAKPPVAKLTHIVGHGLSNKYQTVYLNGQALLSLYGKEPAFPGYYAGSSGIGWDNPTWAFPGNGTNPVTTAPPGSISTEVVPTNSNPGCVSWGAEIFSTTVQNSDGDGLLDSWKANHGYCDASIKEAGTMTTQASCAAVGSQWVDLTGAAPGQQDVFVQYDYMCTFSGGSCSAPAYCSSLNPDGSCNLASGYSFDPALVSDINDGKSAVQKVIDAYAATTGNTHHTPINLHVIKGNAIDETDPTVSCTDNAMAPPVCSFPNQPGVVAWPGGFVFLKNQLIDNVDSNGSAVPCTVTPPTLPPADCTQRFQHGKKDSYHYVLFGHALGLTNWALQDGSLATEPGCPKGGVPCVVQAKNNTVTFTTSAQNGIGPNPDDTACPAYGRVSVAFAITNPNLNGVFCVTSVSGNTFTITVPNPTNSTYLPFTYETDPGLAVASGQAGTASGFSYVGGGDSAIALGSWGTLGATWNAVAGTFMHELGHANGLTHGGLFYDNLAHNANDYTPTFEANCKPNVQSVMSYLFQVDLLDIGKPSNVLDYSGQALNTLNETGVGTTPVFPTVPPNAPFYPNTSWYSPSAKGTAAHCDGSPNPANTMMVLNSDQPVTSLSWTDQDINFDGILEASLRGHTEWTNTISAVPGLDARQVGATSGLVAGGKFFPGGSGGKFFPGGSGGKFFPGGSGGKFFPGGSGGISDLNVVTATSAPRPIRSLTASEGNSPRTITLSWISPTFGVVTQYNIYEAVIGSNFSNTPTLTVPVVPVAGAPPPPPGSPYSSPTINVACNPLGYTFKVTAVSLGGTPVEPQESTGLIVSAGSDGLLTGCYNVTGPSVTSAATQGTIVPVTLTLHDDHNTAGAAVTNLAASTIVAMGPMPGSCATGQTTLLLKGVPQPPVGLSTFGSDGTGGFTFNWDTDGFCAGTYTLTLTLDSGQTGPASPSVQLNVDVNDSDAQQPTINLTPLPVGTVDSQYSGYALSSHGGVGTVTFSYSGNPPPSNMMETPAGVFSGIPCTAGTFNFTVTATDTKLNKGMQGFSMLVNLANTTTIVASNPNPASPVYGQPIPFIVTVAPNSPCAPTKNVTLSSDSSAFLPMALSGGTATFNISSLTAGSHNITATYAGDGNFNSSSTASPLVQQVNRASTTTSLISLLNPSIYGQTVSFTATVSPAVYPTVLPPSGTVTFVLDGSTQLGSALLTNGTVMFTPPTLLPFGAHTITASYGGDSNFLTSTSAPLPQTVQAYTTTSVIASPNPATSGLSVTFTATVSPVSPGFGNPSGTVNFYDGAASLGPGTLNNGVASLTTSALVVGFHPITATYGGDTLFVTSASTPPVIVPVQANVTNTNDSGAGSLRQAITDVNAQSGPQPLGVVFNIPGGGVQTIALASALPALMQSTILDGKTQPGYAGVPLIELDGTNAGGPSVAGLHITAGNSTVRGLDIHSFSGDGILIDTNGSDVIQANYVGTDTSGATAKPNSGNGIEIMAAPSNTVGGAASSMRNLISGNGAAGVRIGGTLATGNIVQGNYIGTDVTGTNPLGNSVAGLSIDGAPNSQVGGTTAGTPNTISFNGTNDVQIFDTGAGGNQIQGNTIQGSTAATTTGIAVAVSLTGNTLSQNSISGHKGLGIDVYPATGVVNPNVSGAANNFPVITSAQVAGGTINGTLNGVANATYTIEFFSNTSCSTSGNGEGAVFLGSASVTLDNTGNYVFAVPIAGLVAGNSITATSTDSSGTTSEFSGCVVAN